MSDRNDRRRAASSKRAAHKSAPNKPTSGLAKSWRTWLLAALLVAGLVVAVLHWADVKKFAALLATAKPAWLGVAVALQLATYLGLSAQWWIVLREGHSKRKQRELFSLTFAKHFADQVVPTAGVSGNALLVDRLVSMGVPRGNAVAALLLQVIAFYLSYAIAALWVLILLFWKNHDSPLLDAAVGVFLVVALAIPVLTLWLHRRGQGKLPSWLAGWSKVKGFFALVGEAPRHLIRNPRLIAILSLLNLLVFVADGATMQACLLALGVHAPLSAGFVAFMMASIAVLLGPVPMGLGSFEAVSIAMLRLFGVPFEAAISATLLFRGFTLWLPLIPGGLLLRREMKKGSG